MEEGTFLEWLKKEGDVVRAGEPLFVVEGDKAAHEVESIASGILRFAPDAPKSGEVFKVGRVLGWLLAEGESAPSSTPINRVGEPVPESVPPSVAPPAAMKTLRQANVPASPRARRVAKEHRVDLTRLRPTGRGGRVRERDVLAAAARRVTPETTGMREVPVSPLRRAIAARLMLSRQNSVPVTLTCRTDATQLVALRQQLKAAGEAGQIEAAPSITDILVKLTGRAMREHPLLTGQWDDDRILLPDTIHIGIAVDTAAGLLVPVIRDVLSSALVQIAARSQRLVAAARAGQLTAADMQGGCFTLSNLGGFGIEAFTPIINPPETAILGIGAIIREAVPLPNGNVTSREQMTLSLTFDHRVIDGAPAARFLQSLRQLIETPFTALV